MEFFSRQKIEMLQNININPNTMVHLLLSNSVATEILYHFRMKLLCERRDRRQARFGWQLNPCNCNLNANKQQII